MKKYEIREMLYKYIENCSQVSVTRMKIDRNPINGFPLKIGRGLLLIRYLYDFELDGYMIIQIKDITSVISGDSERFSEFILKEEGIFTQIKGPLPLNLNNWESVFKDLKSVGKNIIVECESIDSGRFYIGKIIEVKKNSLLLLYFNEFGIWDKEPSEIMFKDITSAKIDTRYINIFSKYVKQ